jgi:NAD-dependent DNA ligase
MYTGQQRQRRDMDETLGILRGIIADGKICEREYEFLAKWLVGHSEFASQWPFSVVAERMIEIEQDNVVTEEEREGLCELIAKLTAGPDPFAEELDLRSAELPLTRPEPLVIFPEHEFVFTGRFLYGTRKRCWKDTEISGGLCKDEISTRTRYLVIGLLGSENWIHSTYGRKIREAMEMSHYGKIHIIDERHWARALSGL